MDTPAAGLCASELIGSIVRSHSEDEEIGNINDLIFDREGSLLAIVVGVGGFMGFREKHVAVDWNLVRLIWKLNDQEFVIHIDVSENMLESFSGSRRMNGHLPDKMSS